MTESGEWPNAQEVAHLVLDASPEVAADIATGMSVAVDQAADLIVDL